MLSLRRAEDAHHTRDTGIDCYDPVPAHSADEPRAGFRLVESLPLASQACLGDPIYTVEDPTQVAALLIVGAAKLEGDLTAEQKKMAMRQFESKFSLDMGGASELLGSASHLLGAPQVIESQLQGLADRNTKTFSRDQSESMIQMMIEVASADGDLSIKQRGYIDGIRSHFVAPEIREGTWS